MKKQVDVLSTLVTLTAAVLSSGCPAKILPFASSDAGRDIGAGAGADAGAGSGASCNPSVPSSLPNYATVRTAEMCPAKPEWLPVTPLPILVQPEPHPSSHCPFYQTAWQYFLQATQAGAQNEPAFRRYPTIDDVFARTTPLVPGALAPAGELRGTPLRSALGNVKQSSGHDILIDQNGRAIYYGVHFNQAFADFVVQNGLTTLAGIQSADPGLSFPPGVVELKSAWQDISEASPLDYADYITSTAWVSSLKQDPTSHAIAEDRDHPRQIRAALLALHVVFTLPGHPEFIWSSFEHVDAQGNPDLAPSALENPSYADPTNATIASAVSSRTMPLYRGNTPYNQANHPFVDTDLALDPATQAFPVGQQSSVYRVFPASKSNTICPDSALVTLNRGVAELFSAARGAGTLGGADHRGNYRLVGATWMDKPVFFTVNSTLQNTIESNPLLPGDVRLDVSQGAERTEVLAAGRSAVDDILLNGSESPFSILGGEDRMSSTAMESFTQSSAFYHCSACHNTMAVDENGIPYRMGRKLLDPKLINVSRVFSQFVLEETR